MANYAVMEKPDTRLMHCGGSVQVPLCGGQREMPGLVQGVFPELYVRREPRRHRSGAVSRQTQHNFNSLLYILLELLLLNQSLLYQNKKKRAAHGMSSPWRGLN